MRVLFDIGHPAQVHFFRNLIGDLRRAGHQTLVVSRFKDITTDLLDHYGIEHVSLSRMGRGHAGMAAELLVRNARLLSLARRFRPDAMMAFVGVSIGPVGMLLGVPRLVLDESEHSLLQRWLGLPFVSVTFTGTGYRGRPPRRRETFRGVWVQAYLDPKRFRPNPEAIRLRGVNPDEPFLVLRLSSWQALHDLGHRGSGDEQLELVVKRLAAFGRVLISSERPLPAAFDPHLNPVPIHDMHHLLSFARLVLSEGGTTAAEAAVLGTPSVFSSRLTCGYLEALDERYRLLRRAPSLSEGMALAESLLARPALRREWEAKRRHLWEETDDINDFMFRLLRRSVGDEGEA